jgi:hypothetical protein
MKQISSELNSYRIKKFEDKKWIIDKLIYEPKIH